MENEKELKTTQEPSSTNGDEKKDSHIDVSWINMPKMVNFQQTYRDIFSATIADAREKEGQIKK